MSQYRGALYHLKIWVKSLFCVCVFLDVIHVKLPKSLIKLRYKKLQSPLYKSGKYLTLSWYKSRQRQ